MYKVNVRRHDWYRRDKAFLNGEDDDDVTSLTEENLSDIGDDIGIGNTSALWFDRFNVLGRHGDDDQIALKDDESRGDGSLQSRRPVEL